jgi:hypothetical protein
VAGFRATDDSAAHYTNAAAQTAADANDAAGHADAAAQAANTRAKAWRDVDGLVRGDR